MKDKHKKKITKAEAQNKDVFQDFSDRLLQNSGKVPFFFFFLKSYNILK